MSWNDNLAKIWTKMVGPSRPTVSELAIYTKYAHKLMEEKHRRLSLLVLGSTPEFRDWGFEENMVVTVMDVNPDYNSTINRELRHKTILEEHTEKYIQDLWQNLNAVDAYDIIIGDLAIGNIPKEGLDDFIKRVSLALNSHGLFLGKSFFVPKDYNIITPTELINRYYEGPQYHPYSALVFDLTMYCIDNDNMLDFQRQYQELIKLKQNGLITEETMHYFENVGWDNEMKFKFHVPKCQYYEDLLNKYLTIQTVEHGCDVYSKNFPLYIATKKSK